jgi:hypothetical protein
MACKRAGFVCSGSAACAVVASARKTMLEMMSLPEFFIVGSQLPVIFSFSTFYAYWGVEDGLFLGNMKWMSLACGSAKSSPFFPFM